MWKIAALALVALLCGCNAQSRPPQAAAAAPKASSPEEFKRYSLTIVGMNYTRRYIDQFFVDGQGGGNLFVSTPDAGGGKSVCCVGWSNQRTLPVTVTVKWQSGGCTESRTTSEGYTYTRNRSEFKERGVIFNGPVPQDPQYFVVHIYDDDRVEVSVSHDYPLPKFQLDSSREDKTPYPPCRN